MTGETNCRSAAKIAGIYSIYGTPKEGCEKHFSQLNVDDCVSVSKASVEKATNQTQWYPQTYPYDCINDGNTPEWMLQTGYKQYYVFDSHAECCAAHYCTNY